MGPRNDSDVGHHSCLSDMRTSWTLWPDGPAPWFHHRSASRARRSSAGYIDHRRRRSRRRLQEKSGAQRVGGLHAAIKSMPSCVTQYSVVAITFRLRGSLFLRSSAATSDRSIGSCVTDNLSIPFRSARSSEDANSLRSALRSSLCSLKSPNESGERRGWRESPASA